MICSDFLEFVAAKFNLDLSFVQLFISLYWLKIRIYIVDIMSWNTKFTQYLVQTHRHVHTKIQVYGENKLTLGETKFLWLFLCNSVKHISLD